METVRESYFENIALISGPLSTGYLILKDIH